VDFFELLPAAVSPNAHGVSQGFVTRRDVTVEAEETPEVDVAFGLDFQVLEVDPAHGALRHVAPHDTRVKSGEEVFLRVGEAVAAAQLDRLVHIDREAALDVLTAEAEAGDVRPTSSVPRGRIFRTGFGVPPLSKSRRAGGRASRARPKVSCASRSRDSASSSHRGSL
jgi:hypothetical protein